MRKCRPKGVQIGPKMEPKSDFGQSFSEFGEPLFLNNPPMVLAYFRGADAPRHVQKACKKLTRRRGTTKNAKKTFFLLKNAKKCSKWNPQCCFETPFFRFVFLHLFFSRFFFVLGCLWGPLWPTRAEFWPPKSDSGVNLAPTLHLKSDWGGATRA